MKTEAEIWISDSDLIHSASALRKAIGWIGILLPFVLMFAGHYCCKIDLVQISISHYFHTCMRDLFVGSLCAIALFLFFYQGYGKKDKWGYLDNWTSNIAGSCSLGIAFFPSTGSGLCCFSGIIHGICGGVFFLLLAFDSIFLFTRTDKSFFPGSKKKNRNAIYYLCGIIIFFCVAAMGIFYLFFMKCCADSTLVFWAETIALSAFGISWLIKGGGFLADKKQVDTEAVI